MKSFVIYTEWKSIFELLPTDSERALLLFLIFDYMEGQDVKETNISLVTSSSVNTAWAFIKPKLDENKKKYEDRLERIRNVNKTKSTRSRDDNDTITTRSRDDNVRVNVNDNVNVNVNVNDNVSSIPTNVVIEDEKKESPKEKRFIKPTLEEIELFIFDNNYSVDAEAFFDFYESKGWKVGKSPMKDWRAAVRTWEKRNKPKFEESFFDVD